MTKDIPDPRKEVAKAMKSGWDKAGRDGAVSPILRDRLVETYGIHPDQAQSYMDAEMKYKSGRGDKPDPSDFKNPVIVPLQPKPKEPSP